MKRIRLNMWQRLGVVASVLWIVIAGWRRREAAVDSTIEYANAVRNLCAEEQRKDCDDAFQTAFERMIDEGWAEVAFVAFAPVVLGWIGAYVVLVTIRWILAGRRAA